LTQSYEVTTACVEALLDLLRAAREVSRVEGAVDDHAAMWIELSFSPTTVELTRQKLTRLVASGELLDAQFYVDSLVRNVVRVNLGRVLARPTSHSSDAPRIRDFLALAHQRPRLWTPHSRAFRVGDSLTSQPVDSQQLLCQDPSGRHEKRSRG
jgi:hypothetical protein